MLPVMLGLRAKLEALCKASTVDSYIRTIPGVGSAELCPCVQGMRDTYRLLSVVLRQRMVAALPALAAAPGAVPELVSAAAGTVFLPQWRSAYCTGCSCLQMSRALQGCEDK